MKKIIYISLLFIAVQTHAQDSKKITEEFNIYSKLILDKNFEKAFDYINEGIFTIAPKEQLMEVMNQTFNNPSLTFEVSMPVVSEFSETKKINDKFYVKFKSFTVIKMKFVGLINADKTAEENQATTNTIKQSLEQKFGVENVKYDEKTQFFEIKATKPVIASSVDKKTWKFITIDDESMKEMLASFIPEELLK